MLRITWVATDDREATLKVEGKLVGDWVGELAQVCTPAARVRQLDLSAVTFVDGAGLALLRQLRTQGIRLAACSGLVAELLQGDGP